MIWFVMLGGAGTGGVGDGPVGSGTDGETVIALEFK
jgi:hypothetical protein